MLKHIYSIPSIKVMSVDTEDILTTWSGASQAKDSGNGTAALVPGGQIDMTDDTNLNFRLICSDNASCKANYL